MSRGDAIILSWLGVVALLPLTAACILVNQSFQDSVRRYDRLDLPDGTGPFPALILLHSCSGPSGRDDLWAEQFRQWGYVVLRVNSFAPRGLKSVCGGGLFSPQERVPDVLAALTYLRGRTDVDPTRIAMAGWSHGGSTVLMTMAAVPEKPGQEIRAAIAFYPGCRGVPPWRATIPTLMLLGEIDDWTPSSPCEELSLRQRKAGLDVRDVIHSGAHHGFDNPLRGTAARHVPEARGGRGATVQYNQAAAEDSVVQVRKFLARHVQPTLQGSPVNP